MYKPMGKHICVKETCAKNVYNEGISYFEVGDIRECVKVYNPEFGNYGYHIYMPTKNSFIYNDIFKEYFIGNFIPYNEVYTLSIKSNNNFLGIKYKRIKKKKFTFNRLSYISLKELHINIFYYIEEIKRLVPDMLPSFQFTILDTLSRLESISCVVSEEDFIKAVYLAKPLFEEMYKLVTDILNKSEDNLLNEEVGYLLKQFEEEMNVRTEVVREVNTFGKGR